MGVEYRTPTETTAPVANTTAGLWTFGTPAGHLLLSNTSGQRIYVRLNSASAASATAHDFSMADGASSALKPADYGVRDFSTVSVWFPTGATVGNFTIRGI